MKSIYTILNQKIYRINQDTAVPTVLAFKAPGISTSLEEDHYNKEVAFNVYINTLEKPGTKSNRELYDDMIQMIRDKKITEIPKIQNKFKIYVDYMIYEDGKEIDHQSIMKPIDPLDKAFILGVATSNETVYRRVKTFNPHLEFKTRNSLPFGITEQPRKTYDFKINNIAVFEDFSDRPEYHGAQYDCPYEPGSSTIHAAFENMTQIYSTAALEIDIQPMHLRYIPRLINLNIEFIYAGLIVAYNNKDVDDVLQENIDAKYPAIDEPIEIPEETNPKHMIPDPESKKDADGRYCPDRDGYFDYYTRTTSTNPKALLVVEDAIDDGSYDVSTMIRKSMVITDIPDIEVGEYVLYCEALNTFL